MTDHRTTEIRRLLLDLRDDFPEDDYRQAKIDVAIAMVDEVESHIADLDNAGFWESPVDKEGRA